MNTRMLLPQAAVIVTLLFDAAPGSSFSPEDTPRPEVVEQVLNMRRAELRSLEESTARLRSEVAEQLKDVVATQSEITAKAESQYQEARRSRESAESTFMLYRDGILPQDIETAKNEVQLTDARLSQAMDDYKLALKRRDEGQKIQFYDLINKKMNIDIYTIDKEQSEIYLSSLVNHDGPTELKRLSALVEAAKASEAAKERSLMAVRDKGNRLQNQANKLKARAPEDFVIALINESIRSEEKVVDLLGEARTIEDEMRQKAADMPALTSKLRKIRDEADTLMGQAKAQLIEATTLGTEIRTRRSRLVEAEVRLKKGRDLVESLEKQFRKSSK